MSASVQSWPVLLWTWNSINQIQSQVGALWDYTNKFLDKFNGHRRVCADLSRISWHLLSLALFHIMKILTLQGMPGACSGRRTVLPYSTAIDEHRFDSCGVLGRVLEVREVDHRLRIKHHQVGEVALPDLSAPGKSEYQGWTGRRIYCFSW